jgi:hypothetical protein
MVVVPEKWFADPSANDSDIIPSDWIRYNASQSTLFAKSA